jgi:hypothetical protein
MIETIGPKEKQRLSAREDAAFGSARQKTKRGKKVKKKKAAEVPAR